MVFEILILLGLVLCSGFFSSSELAVTMASRVRLRTRAERGHWGARAEKLLERPERTIVTCLVGNNLTNIALAAYGRETLLANFSVSPTAADIITTLWIVPLVLLLGEILPKALAMTYPNRILAAVATPLFGVRILLGPLILVSFGVADIVRRLARLRSNLLDFLSREDLKQFVARSEKHGHVDSEELELIYKIFEFWKLDPKKLVRPVEAVSHLPVDSTVGQAKELMRENRVRRLPLTDASGSGVIGVVSATRILGVQNSQPVRQYMREPARVSLEHGIDRLLAELQRSPSQVAVVESVPGSPGGIILLDDALHHLLGRPTRGSESTRGA